MQLSNETFVPSAWNSYQRACFVSYFHTFRQIMYILSSIFPVCSMFEVEKLEQTLFMRPWCMFSCCSWDPDACSHVVHESSLVSLSADTTGVLRSNSLFGHIEPRRKSVSLLLLSFRCGKCSYYFMSIDTDFLPPPSKQ